MPHSEVEEAALQPMPTVELLTDTSCRSVEAMAPPGPAKRVESATPSLPPFSLEGEDRKMGTLRTLAGKYMGQPGVLSFSGGFPTPQLFPFAKVSVTTVDGTTVEISGPQMAAAQQYNSELRGYGPLLAWAEAHTQRLHAPPPAAGHQVLITNGGNHSLDMVFALYLDRGDSFLVEEYSYPVAVESIAAPKGYKPIGVPIDSQGIIPAALEAVLQRLQATCLGRAASSSSTTDSDSGCEAGRQQQQRAQAQGQGQLHGEQRLRFPKLLYTIPHGQNPTGCTIPLTRKREVYEICRRYGIMILEDDPYVYLQYRLGPGGQPGSAEDMPGLTGLGAHGSYLSLDVDGRVIRADTFAKFMVPGLRLGWVTANPVVTNKLVCMIQQQTVGPCSLSQVVAAETLRAWGDAGLDAHLRVVQAEYARRAALMLQAAQRELSGLAEWAAPTAGMFLWLRLVGEDDAAEVWRELSEAAVIVIPGKPMHWRCEDTSFRSPFIRVSFSQATDEAIVEGFRRMGAVLRRRREQAAAAAAAAGRAAAMVEG